jgi:hypothetical protein
VKSFLEAEREALGAGSSSFARQLRLAGHGGSDWAGRAHDRGEPALSSASG